MTDTTAVTPAKPDMARFIKANIRDYALLLSLLAIMIFSWLASLAGISATRRPSFIT